MTSRRASGAGTALAALLVTVSCGAGPDIAEIPPGAVPSFGVDPFWPRPLPDGQVLGPVAGLTVDDRGHIWIVHRPAGVPDGEVAAPPVVEFNPLGAMVQAWGGPGAGYDWPGAEHGIFVDHQDFVWIGGNGPGDHHVLKFTRAGEFVLQIGMAGMTAGSNDRLHLGGPADFVVDAERNEVYIADGYTNRRVAVFHAASGEYRRHWGAYGEPPVDTDPGDYDPDAPPSAQFRTPVHGVLLSFDGLVYVADRQNNRIQVFHRDGTFLAEGFVAPETRGLGAAFDMAFSADLEQRFLYVADGENDKVWILRRDDLEVVGEFGGTGREPGEFTLLHNIAVDPQGNIYTAEVSDARRVQKFIFRGLVIQ